MSKLSYNRAAFLVLSAVALAMPSVVQADPTRFADCTPAGRVVSITSDVVATRSAQRTLACGDELCVGDLVATGAGGSVGILNGGILTQIGENTRAKLAMTPAGTPDVELQEGTVRMIDARPEGAAGRLAALGAKADIRRNDAEARIASGAGEICSHSGLLSVNGTRLEPGRCAAVDSGALRLVPDGVEGRKLAALAGSCDPGPVIAPIAHIAPTPPVAAPPQRAAAPLPLPPGGPSRNGCESPGGCDVNLGDNHVMEPYPGTGGSGPPGSS